MTDTPTKPEIALKPCPCCGSERLIPPPKRWADGCVYCRSCGLRANSPEAWNHRTPVHDADLVEALQDLLSATEEVGYVHYAPFRAKARAAIARALPTPREGGE